MKRKILIVDDHPFIIQGYKNAITRYNPKQYEFFITEAKDCESGYNIITNPETSPFDVAFLDISMPSYEEKNIFSGEDLAKLISEYMPKCKIILLTMYTELLKIKTIIKTIKRSRLSGCFNYKNNSQHLTNRLIWFKEFLLKFEIQPISYKQTTPKRNYFPKKTYLQSN